MKSNIAMLLLIGAVILSAVIIGCNTNPIDSATGGRGLLNAITGGPVQFAAKVATMDQAQRKLTFAGAPDTVIANENCEVVKLQNGIETPAQFGEIKCGDSLQVFGERRMEQTVYAYRLRICVDSGSGNQFAGRVRTMDMNQRMLTFAGKSDTCVANLNCQYVRWQNGGEAPMMFWEIKLGDSVEIAGQRNQNGYMYASKIKVCGDKTSCQYDVAFRDTITAIDYAAGSFTVKNRPENILVDSATLIYGVMVRVFEPPVDGGSRQQLGTGAGDGEGSGYRYAKDTVLTLTDLAVGDIVEIRAKTIDENTLLAVYITLAACNNVEKKCVEFSTTLASIDVDARIVTFDGYSYIGTVCNGASLIGLDGETLTLADFAVGDYVAVKGFPLEGDTLKICQMTKTTP
ncbi:hypothetical protein C3F09_06500 [candidate division GN15 bacterium]|uniref:DUF5666 domain-containing protein n=1 Tax=candidate division GN15 bacterium TaxID=2072418 RepID=A0A855X0V9_9BACT|nr:MAG: hypothetical protein C3F09_06500 [candidate division GN15 bacterium]